MSFLWDLPLWKNSWESTSFINFDCSILCATSVPLEISPYGKKTVFFKALEDECRG